MSESTEMVDPHKPSNQLTARELLMLMHTRTLQAREKATYQLALQLAQVAVHNPSQLPAFVKEHESELLWKIPKS